MRIYFGHVIYWLAENYRYECSLLDETLCSDTIICENDGSSATQHQRAHPTDKECLQPAHPMQATLF